MPLRAYMLGMDETAQNTPNQNEYGADSIKMLKGLDGCIDVIVPRGGKSLVARVQQEARVPVLAHAEGGHRQQEQHAREHERVDGEAVVRSGDDVVAVLHARRPPGDSGPGAACARAADRRRRVIRPTLIWKN